MYRTMPYFSLYGNDYKSFRDKMSNKEMLDVLDKMVDISLFGFSDIEFKNEFQKLYFDKLINVYEKNLKNYCSKIENGKKGGRPRKTVGIEIENPKNQQAKKIDTYADPLAEKCFQIYSENCKNLLPIKWERNSRDIRELLANYLYETNNDLEYWKEVCIKANEQKQICDVRLDLKSTLKNHISIANGKFKKNDNTISELKFK